MVQVAAFKDGLMVQVAALKDGLVVEWFRWQLLRTAWWSNGSGGSS